MLHYLGAIKMNIANPRASKQNEFEGSSSKGVRPLELASGWIISPIALHQGHDWLVQYYTDNANFSSSPIEIMYLRLNCSEHIPIFKKPIKIAGSGPTNNSWWAIYFGVYGITIQETNVLPEVCLDFKDAQASEDTILNLYVFKQESLTHISESLFYHNAYISRGHKNYFTEKRLHKHGSIQLVSS